MLVVDESTVEQLVHISTSTSNVSSNRPYVFNRRRPIRSLLLGVDYLWDWIITELSEGAIGQLITDISSGANKRILIKNILENFRDTPLASITEAET